MYFEHRKESAAKQLEAHNLEAAKEDVKSTPTDCSSTEKYQNGTVMNGTSKPRSEMKEGIPAEGVENKAYVVDEKD
jgi:hypothetical protein